MQHDEPGIALVHSYLRALEAGEAGEALARFFTPDAIQTELPNRLNANGQTSNLAEIQARSIAGQRFLKSQHFQITNSIAAAHRVAIEARWAGVLAIALGPLPAGTELRASFAMFFELVDGKIHRQRNYDCFEPW